MNATTVFERKPPVWWAVPVLSFVLATTTLAGTGVAGYAVALGDKVQSLQTSKVDMAAFAPLIDRVGRIEARAVDPQVISQISSNVTLLQANLSALQESRNQSRTAYEARLGNVEGDTRTAAATIQGLDVRLARMETQLASVAQAVGAAQIPGTPVRNGGTRQ